MCVFLFIYIDQVTFTFISVINDMYIHVYTRACVCARASMFLYHIYLCISICTSGWYWVKIGYKSRLDLRSAGLGPLVTSRSSQACAISQVTSPQLFVEALWMSWSTSFPAALAIWLACNCFFIRTIKNWDRWNVLVSDLQIQPGTVVFTPK